MKSTRAGAAVVCGCCADPECTARPRTPTSTTYSPRLTRHPLEGSRLAPRASRLAPRASRLAPRASRLAPRASRLASVLVVILVILRRRRIELPAVPIALDDLVGGLQLLVVLIGDPQRGADVVHAVLIRCGVVAAGGFVADGVGLFPVRIDVAAGDRGAGFG